jgi:hypothetical protein
MYFLGRSYYVIAGLNAGARVPPNTIIFDNVDTLLPLRVIVNV